MVSRLWLLLCALVLCGCDLSPVERATKNIETGAESISKGISDLGKIDPLALNKLMTENQGLRTAAETLRAKLQEVDGVASVHVGPGSKVYLEITGYRGRLRLSGWVDNERNKFIENRVLVLIEKPFVLDTDWVGIKYLPNSNTWQDKNARMVEVAERSFDKYIAHPFVLPSADMQLHAVDRRFMNSGPHSVILQVTPEAVDTSGNWELEYKMYVETADRKDVVTVGRVDSQTEKYELGKPLPPKEIAFAQITVSPAS